MNQKKQLLANTIIIALGKLGTQIVSFILLPLYTAQLTTEEYGTYDFLVTLSVFLLPIITLLIEESMFRFLIDAETIKDKKKIITATTLYMLAGTIFFSIIATIVVLLSGYQYGWLFIVFVISNILISLSNAISRGMGRIKIYSLSNFFLGALTIILNLVFILAFKWGTAGLLWANTIANAIVAIFVLIRMRFLSYVNMKNLNKRTLREMVKYSVPLVPNNLSWIIISLSDRLMITWLIGSGANGIYSIANRFPNIIYTCYGFFSTAWKESAARIVKEENKNEYYNAIYKDLVNFLKAIVIGLIAIMPFAFKILIAEGYNDAYVYIPILTIGIYYTNISNFYGGIFTAYKDTKIMGTTTMFGAFLNVLINLIFLKLWGIYAATISTLVSTLVVYLYRRAKLKKYIRLRENIDLTYFAVLAIVLITYYIRNNIVSAIILVFAVIYCYSINRKFINTILRKGKNRILRKKQTAKLS